jgi:hypothetical protein
MSQNALVNFTLLGLRGLVMRYSIRFPLAFLLERDHVSIVYIPTEEESTISNNIYGQLRPLVVIGQMTLTGFPSVV